MKKSVIAAAVAAFVVSPVSFAGVKFSGQVNSIAILDSDRDDIEIADNEHSGSRFRFTADKEFSSLKVGAHYEIQLQDNDSLTLEDDLTNDRGEVRYSTVWLSGDFGKISIGKGNSATEDTFEAHGFLGHYLAQDLTWLAVNGSLENPIAYRGQDGLSRVNRVRYDSPNFSGFTFAASQINGGTTDVAARYKGKLLGGGIVARLGFSSADDDALSRTQGSFAYKTPFGLGFAYSYGENDADFDTNWLNITYQVGKTVFSFGTGDDSNDNEQTVLGVNYKPTKGVEIYLNTVDAENADGTEPSATYIGSRVKF